MPNVTLEYDAAKQLADLPKPIKSRMIELFVRLADWPDVSGAKPLSGRLADWPDVSGAKPLSGKLAGHYRLRTGDYRLQFRVETGMVIIEQVGHRGGFYGESVE